MFAPFFKEATIKTVIVDAEDGPIPSLPVLPALCLVFCDGTNFFSGRIGPSLIGKSCIVHIAYAAELDSLVTSLPGYLGRNNEATLTSDYISMIGSSNPIWEFLKDDYQDI